MSARSALARCGFLAKVFIHQSEIVDTDLASAFLHAAKISWPVRKNAVYCRSNLCDVEQKRHEFWQPTPGIIIPAFPINGAP
jgi:hypothetical protein